MVPMLETLGSNGWNTQFQCLKPRVPTICTIIIDYLNDRETLLITKLSPIIQWNKEKMYYLCGGILQSI
jgi:hypothetical protein